MTNDPIQKIAVLGTGLMGLPMARNLQRAGMTVAAWNRTPDKAQVLAADGAVVCQSVAQAVQGAECVITMLAGERALDHVMFGEGGVQATAPKDALIIDMSSLAPGLARAQHARLKSAGFAHLDAPVSGGVPGAEAGNLSIMVGGAEQDFERARPVFDHLGTAFHLGDAGAGQVCKMVNQTIVHITIGAVTEGLLLAAAMGVEAQKVRQAISGGFCQSRILELHGERMVQRNFVPGGPLQFSVKDLLGAEAHAAEVDLSLPLTQSVLQAYQGLVDDGQGALDHSALLLAYEARNQPHRVSPNKSDTLPE